MRWLPALLLLPYLVSVPTGCRPSSGEQRVSTDQSADAPSGVLVRVGSGVVTEADLKHHLSERFGGRGDADTRQRALTELVRRARWAEAAQAEGLGQDVVVRAERARVMARRFEEEVVSPRIRDAWALINEGFLRQIYESRADAFATEEKRRVAVLWLNPGSDEARRSSYQEKLSQARDWLLEQPELRDHPEEGFSVLSIDHSEHAASRFRGGDVGWVARSDDGVAAWRRRLADIVFRLAEVGEVSPVVSGEEGVFLVRLMDLQPESRQSFESVRSRLEKEAKDQLRKQVEDQIHQELEHAYPSVPE
jgi:hypothetical protein